MNRDVALEIVPEQLTENRQALERFQREASEGNRPVEDARSGTTIYFIVTLIGSLLKHFLRVLD